MAEKLLSIIIPCYNVENYILRCFESIEKQTVGMDKLEIIMVDDCSSDSTWNILTELEKKYPDSVMIIHCDENGRQGRARNIGLSYASAPYIMFVDSDDFIEPDTVEVLYAPFIKDDFDFTMCGFWRDDLVTDYRILPRQDGTGDRHFRIDSDEKRGTFILCMSIGSVVWGKIYKKSFLTDNDIFFPEGYTYEDHFFMMLLYLYAKSVMILDNRCYHYYVNPTSTVLKKDSSHHYDALTVDDLTWEECAKRGFLDKFRKQLECYFLLLGYFAPLKNISFRFEQPPYDYFLKLKENTLRKIPDYKSNPYIKDYILDFYQAMLPTLNYDITEDEFYEICKAIRQKYEK